MAADRGADDDEPASTADVAGADGREDDEALSNVERLDLLRWHLDRYDRLRASTAARAAVVLSAGAILSAGNVLLLTQLLGASGQRLAVWLLAPFTVAAGISASLVVLSLLHAANVLVTPRASREMLAKGGPVPVSLIFNGTDTVATVATFEEFRAAVADQGRQAVLAAAEVELWVGIHQHRHRYVRLRGAVRLLRYAAVAFVLILSTAMVVNLVSAF